MPRHTDNHWLEAIASGGSSIDNGNKTVAAAGTAEPLAGATPCRSVVVAALESNTGTICVGGESVVASLTGRSGIPLSAGDSISLDIDDLSKVYLDATVDGDGVSYTYVA